MLDTVVQRAGNDDRFLFFMTKYMLLIASQEKVLTRVPACLLARLQRSLRGPHPLSPSRAHARPHAADTRFLVREFTPFSGVCPTLHACGSGPPPTLTPACVRARARVSGCLPVAARQPHHLVELGRRLQAQGVARAGAVVERPRPRSSNSSSSSPPISAVERLALAAPAASVLRPRLCCRARSDRAYVRVPRVVFVHRYPLACSPHGGGGGPSSAVSKVSVVTCSSSLGLLGCQRAERPRPASFGLGASQAAVAIDSAPALRCSCSKHAISFVLATCGHISQRRPQKSSYSRAYSRR
jgi:hypothetical protein